MLNVTATNLPRIMACNGSLKMNEAEAINLDVDNTVRNEGDAAHWFVEQVHSGQSDAVALINSKAPNGVFITGDMHQHLQEYLNYIQNASIEVVTDWNNWKWSITGRADAIKYDAVNYVLEICDLKYGWGIVEPDENFTLISHACAWRIANPDKRIEKIKLTIFQPRPQHHLGSMRTFEFDVLKLNEYQAQIDETLLKPNDFLNTSKQCYKCPAIATCPAARAAQMNAIEATERVFNESVNNEQLDFELDHISRALEILKEREKAFQDLAIHRLKEGQTIKNRSLETSLTNYTWKKDVTAETIEMLSGKDITDKKMVTPAQAISRFGLPEEFVKAFRTRHKKGVKLVRVDINTKAQKMFKQK